MKNTSTTPRSKILSLVLTIAMIFSMLPVTAFAEAEPDDNTYATSGVTVSGRDEDETPDDNAYATSGVTASSAQADAPMGFAPAALTGGVLTVNVDANMNTKELMETAITNALSGAGANAIDVTTLKFTGGSGFILGAGTISEYLNTLTNLKTLDLSGFAGTFVDGAFQNCTAITAVKLPAGAAVSQYMFSTCLNLKAVAFGDTLPTFGTSAFYGVSSPMWIISDSVKENYTIPTENAPSGARLPTITGTATPNAGNTLTLSVTPDASTATAVTYQWQKDGTDINGETSRIYAKTAAGADSGSYTCAVSLAGTTYTTEAVDVAVAVPLPVISTASGALAGGTVGTAYSVTLAASNSPTSWTVSSDALPTGLTLNNSGVISGTPTVANTFTFSVTATNSGGTSSPKSFTITVNKGAAPAAPTGLNKTDVTVAGANDGTITGVDETMEYKKQGDAGYTAVTGTPITGLAPDTYLVRYKENANYNAGTDATIVIADGAAPPPAPTYAVTVNSGTGNGDFAEGTTVTITANTPQSGQQFKEWTIAPSVTFTDSTNATSATAKFTMPSQAVTATATYEAIPPTPDTTPPTVTANPPENSLLALENAEIVLTFSEPIKTSSFDATLTTPTQSVLYSFSWTGGDTVCTLTLGTLTQDTTYTLAITAEDMADNALATNTSITYKAVWVHDMPSVDNISDITAPVNFPRAVLPMGTTYTDAGGTIFQHNEVKLIMEQIPTQTKAGLETDANSAYPNSEHILYLDIALVDISTGAKVQPGQPVTLLLPYPAGYSYASTNEFTILHWNSITNQMEELTPTPTPNGLQITVTGFSPFAIIVNPAVNPNTPSTSSSSGGGSSSSGKIDAASMPATQWVEVSDAQALAKSAAEQGADSVLTRSSGEAGIRKKALQTLGKSGLTYRHDTVADSAVQVRVYVDDPSAATKDILTSGYTSGANVDKTTAIINKWFSNDAAVIALDQQGDFGMNVRIAALVDLSGMGTNKLYFYSYDKATNKYKLIVTEYRIDSKGYVHFSTVLAGSIIITDRPLTKIGADAEDEAYEPPMTGGSLDNPTTGGDGTGMYIPPAKAQPQDFTVADSIIETIAADGVLKLKTRTVPAAIHNTGGEIVGALAFDQDAHEENTDNLWLLGGIGAILLLIAVTVSWAVIPRRNDPLLSVEEYRKKQ